MAKIINMQSIRYLNLFNKITGIKTNRCFNYNSSLVFVVPKKLLLKAIGRENINLRKISKITGKRIRVVGDIQGDKKIENFITSLTKPIQINEIIVDLEDVTIKATHENRAMLIGRNKTKLEELKKIIQDNFKRDVKIVE